MGFLTQAVDRIRRELDQAPEPGEAEGAKAAPGMDFAGALSGPGTSLIAELKRASPSAGPIAAPDVAAQVARYEWGGASALSVLTEHRWFDGSPEDLRTARAAATVPLLRKDFIVHPAQIAESRRLGADAVLLIVAALSDEELSGLGAAARRLGMAALVEVHSESDLERALAGGSPLIGVNARDLETLEVNRDHALALARRVPPDRILVIESGIGSRDDVMRASDAGADAVLVGEHLMRSSDPAGAIRQLLGGSGGLKQRSGSPPRKGP